MIEILNPEQLERVLTGMPITSAAKLHLAHWVVKRHSILTCLSTHADGNTHCNANSNAETNLAHGHAECSPQSGSNQNAYSHCGAPFLRFLSVWFVRFF
jgi:hypothetical protein